MSGLHILDYAVMALYLIALVVIGIVSTRGGSGKNTKDFILGGGKMPVLALGISCLMASLSAFSLVMVPGEIFNNGLDYWILGIVSPFLIILSTAIFMRFYFKIGAFTPFEYLERRYSPAIRSLVASMTLYARLIYLGMVMFSTSKVLEGAAGWPAWLTIISCATVSLIFTACGGLKAVVWTDVMQFVVLIGGLCCIMGALFIKVDGGLFGGIAYAFKEGHGLDWYYRAEFYQINPYVRLSFWLLAFSNFVLMPISIMASDQMTVQRLLASGNYKNSVKTQTVNILLNFPTTLILLVIGLLTFSFFHQNPELMKSVKSGDTAVFQFIAGQLPSPLPGLVIAGMLAAVISTLNAVFNSMATVYVKELHIRCIDKSCPEEKQVMLTRVGTVVIGVIACALGLTIAYAADWIKNSVVEVQTIFSVFDVIVIPAFIYAVLSKRACALQLWLTSGFLWGMKIVMITWYTLSSRHLKVWKDGGMLGECGWAAMPFNWKYSIPCFIAGVLLFVLFLNLHKRKSMWSTLIGVFSLMGFGSGAAMLIWAWISNVYPMPNAISFSYVGLPINIVWIVAGVLWLTLGKVQPKEKYQGLTLFDQGEVVNNDK